MHVYAPPNVTVTTPRLELRGASDDLLEELATLVRGGQADADPPPFDDPSSFYEADPDVRVDRGLQAVWRGRGRVASDGRPVLNQPRSRSDEGRGRTQP